MNPYLSRSALDVDLAEIDAWNAGIRRSRQEYAAVSSAACLAPGCPELGVIEAGFCRDCAFDHGLCWVCQQRSKEGGRTLCWTCMRGRRGSAYVHLQIVKETA